MTTVFISIEESCLHKDVVDEGEEPCAGIYEGRIIYMTSDTGYIPNNSLCINIIRTPPPEMRSSL